MAEFTPLPFRESQITPQHPEKNMDESQSGPPEIPIEEIIFDKDKDLLGEGRHQTSVTLRQQSIKDNVCAG